MILADAHVHIYDCFDLSVFLNAAVLNFSAEASRLDTGGRFSAVLFLTETSSDNKFNQIWESIDGQSDKKFITDWTFHHTKESCSIYARRNDGRDLFLAAGHQIVTAENLEVLALATEKLIEDGDTLEDSIQNTINADAVPVIPWGAGKWLGRRGEILGEYLKGSHEQCLFLGDNGGRPVFWSRPSHFSLAENRGIRILPGSDPLPFEHECRKAGNYGFSIRDSISLDYPARDIKALLREPSTCINTYGQLERLLPFFRNQILMQMLKRKRKKAFIGK